MMKLKVKPTFWGKKRNLNIFSILYTHRHTYTDAHTQFIEFKLSEAFQFHLFYFYSEVKRKFFY